MDPKGVRFTIISLLLQQRDYNSRSVEDLMADAMKLDNYVALGGQPVVPKGQLH